MFYAEFTDHCYDLQEIDKQPMREENIQNFWYFVLFTIFGTFVTFNMVVCVLLPHCKNLLVAITASNCQEKSACSDSCATAAVNGNVDNEIAPSTESKIVKFVRIPHFDQLSYLICIAYIISLTLDYYGQTEKYTMVLQYLDLIFGLLLIIETILRVVGMGAKAFFKNGWNVFDLVTCILLVAGKYWLQSLAAWDFFPLKKLFSHSRFLFYSLVSHRIYNDGSRNRKYCVHYIIASDSYSSHKTI